MSVGGLTSVNDYETKIKTAVSAVAVLLKSKNQAINVGIVLDPDLSGHNKSVTKSHFNHFKSVTRIR